MRSSGFWVDVQEESEENKKTAKVSFLKTASIDKDAKEGIVLYKNFNCSEYVAVKESIKGIHIFLEDCYCCTTKAPFEGRHGLVTSEFITHVGDITQDKPRFYQYRVTFKNPEVYNYVCEVLGMDSQLKASEKPKSTSS